MSEIVRCVEESIAAGLSDACLIEWREAGRLFSDGSPDPIFSISCAVRCFLMAGWKWRGLDIEKDGWMVWFRSQGQLAPPICQWSRIEQ